MFCLQKYKYLYFVFFMFFICFHTARLQAKVQVEDTCIPDVHLNYLKQSVIAEKYLPSSKEVVGAIEEMVGDAIIFRKDTLSGFIAKKGDKVHLDDTIFTLSDASLRLKMSNRDIAMMGSCANLRIDVFIDAREEKKKTARFKSSAGALLFYVLKLFGYRDISFDVHTPSSVASVRGTKFGLITADTSQDNGEWLFEQDFGPIENLDSKIDCFCENGAVEVNGMMVKQGEMYNGSTGKVSTYTKEDLEKFNSQFHTSLLSTPMKILPWHGAEHVPDKIDDKIEFDEDAIDSLQEQRDVEAFSNQSVFGGDRSLDDDNDQGEDGNENDPSDEDNDQSDDDNDQSDDDNDQSDDDNDQSDDDNDQSDDDNDDDDDDNDDDDDDNDDDDDDSDDDDDDSSDDD